MSKHEKIFISKSDEDTIRIAEIFCNNLSGGDIVALYGELGSGKTHFVKGIGKGLGIKKEITSPTFVISQHYKGKDINLIHIDLYRVNSFSELEDLGWYDFLTPNNIIVIEWADKIDEELKNYPIIKVFFTYLDDTSRMIRIIYAF